MSRQQIPRTWLVAAVVCGLAAAASLSSLASAAARQQVRSTPERLAHMQHHFVQVSLIHEALIRGDLPAVRGPATLMADTEAPPDVAASTAQYVAAMRLAARRAADARDLASGAAATASMLLSCGECHRAAGTMPALPAPTQPAVGGLVGHMLEHQRAADEMLEGLVVPSQSQWIRGATRLAAAPLHQESLPRDRKLTAEVRASEARVHQLADRAIKAGSWKDRGDVYAQVLTTCAGCHSLHGVVWGPRRAPAGVKP
jgi:mono/diheme cytochrome c family protein